MASPSRTHPDSGLLLDVLFATLGGLTLVVGQRFWAERADNTPILLGVGLMGVVFGALVPIQRLGGVFAVRPGVLLQRALWALAWLAASLTLHGLERGTSLRILSRADPLTIATTGRAIVVAIVMSMLASRAADAAARLRGSITIAGRWLIAVASASAACVWLGFLLADVDRWTAAGSSMDASLPFWLATPLQVALPTVILSKMAQQWVFTPSDVLRPIAATAGTRVRRVRVESRAASLHIRLPTAESGLLWRIVGRLGMWALAAFAVKAVGEDSLAGQILFPGLGLALAWDLIAWELHRLGHLEVTLRPHSARLTRLDSFGRALWQVDTNPADLLFRATDGGDGPILWWSPTVAVPLGIPPATFQALRAHWPAPSALGSPDDVPDHLPFQPTPPVSRPFPGGRAALLALALPAILTVSTTVAALVTSEHSFALVAVSTAVLTVYSIRRAVQVRQSSRNQPDATRAASPASPKVPTQSAPSSADTAPSKSGIPDRAGASDTVCEVPS
jgi:hypothetical protein